MRITSNSAAATAAPLARLGAFLFAWRNLLFTIVLVGILAGFRPVPLLGDPHADRWLDALGLLVVAAGQAIRAAVIGLAYIQRGGRNGKVHAEELVQTGIFAHVRNPLYLGNFLAQAGLYLIHNNPWVYALGLTFTIVSYRAIVVAEETYLRRRFGARYQDYCRRVPRWLPRLGGLRSTLSAVRFRWRRVLFKEHTSTYTGLAGVIALLVYQALVEPSYPWRADYFIALGILLAAASIAWTLVHRQKKSRGRLRQGPRKSAGERRRRQEATARRAIPAGAFPGSQPGGGRAVQPGVPANEVPA